MSSAVAEVLPSRTAAYVNNGGRKTEFRNTQSHRFFEHTRSPTAAQRRNYFTNRRLFLPATEKARSDLMDTTVRDSRDHVRAKVVIVSLRYFIPANV